MQQQPDQLRLAEVQVGLLSEVSMMTETLTKREVTQ